MYQPATKDLYVRTQMTAFTVHRGEFTTVYADRSILERDAVQIEVVVTRTGRVLVCCENPAALEVVDFDTAARIMGTDDNQPRLIGE